MTSFLDSIPTVDMEKPYIKAVLYGPEGAGKTYFAGSAPNPIWCDFERSTETLRKVEHLKTTKVLRPKGFEEVKKFALEASKVYETLVFDTISSMQVMYMTEYMRKVARAERRSEYLPYQGDWRYGSNEMTEFWLLLQSLPVNVIFIAHNKEVTDKEGRFIKWAPAIAPSWWRPLRQFVNVVCYMESAPKGTNERTRRFYVNSTNQIQAKNRLGIQQAYLENVTFEELFNVR